MLCALFLIVKPAKFQRGDLAVLPLSIFDLSIFFDANSGMLFRGEVGVLRLSNAFLQCVPMLLLECLSLDLFSPIQSLIAIFFNVSGLLLLLLWEGLWWAARRSAVRSQPFSLDGIGRSRVDKRSDALKTPLLDTPPGEEDENRDARAVNDEHNEVMYQPQRADEDAGMPLRFLRNLAFPFVILSFFPQILSIFGIPFVMMCCRRLLSPSSPSGENQTQPLKTRGIFLLSLNMVSLFVTLLVLLPGIAFTMAVLFCTDNISSVCTRGKVEGRAIFRLACQRLVSVLAYCYLPFLSRPPEIESQNFSSHEAAVGWKVILAAVFFLGMEVALPLADLVTSIQYSVPGNSASVALIFFITAGARSWRRTRCRK